MKYILLLCALPFLSGSCRKSYFCNCHLSGNTDTILYLGQVSSGTAQSSCTTFGNQRPADSCYLSAVIIK